MADAKETCRAIIAAALNEFIKDYNPQIAYKLISGNIGQTGKKLTLPLYMAMFL